MPLILPENTVTQTLDAVPSVKTAADVERQIQATIERILSIGLRKCCDDFRRAADDFRARRNAHELSGKFAYLDDPYLRTLAIAGEQHICQEGRVRQLPALFDLRENYW